jgi:hypothetical protein
VTDKFVPILLITLTIVLIVILFIVMSYILLRLRALEVQRGAGEEIGGGAPTQGEVVPTKGPSKHPAIIDQLRSRYAFVLARHIELVIDQGQLDRQRNKEAVPESSAPIGGLRGEIQSWLPQSYVQRFYRVGIQSLTATAEELAELRSEVRGLVDEILNRLHMNEQGQGIGQLITMHTLDFDVQARGEEYEADLAEQTQATSDDDHT